MAASAALGTGATEATAKHLTLEADLAVIPVLVIVKALVRCRIVAHCVKKIPSTADTLFGCIRRARLVTLLPDSICQAALLGVVLAVALPAVPHLAPAPCALGAGPADPATRQTAPALRAPRISTTMRFGLGEGTALTSTKDVILTAYPAVN